MALDSFETNTPEVENLSLDSTLSMIEPTGIKWVEPPFPDSIRYCENPSREITLEQICFVKALKDSSCIRQSPDGRLYLPTLATVTNGEETRITNHTSINHLVNDNQGGYWGTSEVIVVMPGKNAFELNGVPENLTHYDTFWSRDVQIPDGSIIIWRNKKLENYMEHNGYINIELNLEEENEEIKERIAGLEKSIHEPNIATIEQDKCVYIRNELIKYAHDQLDKIIRKVVEKMGYTYLPYENGRYSNHNNLDHQLIELGEKYGIRTFVPHSDTYSGLMEKISFFTLGALTIISRMNKDPKPEDDLNEVFGSYASIMNDIGTVENPEPTESEILSYFENLSDGDKNVRQIFASELLYWLKNNIEKVGNDKKIRKHLKLLFDMDPYLKELILQFSAKSPELNKHLNELYNSKKHSTKLP